MIPERQRAYFDVAISTLHRARGMCRLDSELGQKLTDIIMSLHMAIDDDPNEIYGEAGEE